jgi:hypothetical protein
MAQARGGLPGGVLIELVAGDSELQVLIREALGRHPAACPCGSNSLDYLRPSFHKVVHNFGRIVITASRSCAAQQLLGNGDAVTLFPRSFVTPPRTRVAALG